MPRLLPNDHPRIQRIQELFWRDGFPPFSYPFADLPTSDRLTYELVNWENIEQYVGLFEHDPNPYLMKDFLTRKGLEQYAVHLLEYGRYSTKRGACDWLLRMKSGQYVGVLHLHAVNRELINGRFSPCMIGYAIAEPFRGRGFATEAATQLLAEIPTRYHRYEVRAEVNSTNRASQRVLRKVGLRWKEKYGDTSYYYKKLVDPIPTHTVDELMQGIC